MGIVSYDLAIWEGDRSAVDAAALEEYGQLHTRYVRGDPEPPTPRIAAYVRALLDRYPEIDTEAGEDSPWATGPLMREASGLFFYLPLMYSQCDEVSTWVAQLAQDHGLVCYDPQVGKLRP
jgi:hypothetical protein